MCSTMLFTLRPYIQSRVSVIISLESCSAGFFCLQLPFSNRAVPGLDTITVFYGYTAPVIQQPYRTGRRASEPHLDGMGLGTGSTVYGRPIDGTYDGRRVMCHHLCSSSHQHCLDTILASPVIAHAQSVPHPLSLAVYSKALLPSLRDLCFLGGCLVTPDRSRLGVPTFLLTIQVCRSLVRHWVRGLE